MLVLLLNLPLILVGLLIAVAVSILLEVIVHNTDLNIVAAALTDQELIRLIRGFLTELVNRLEDYSYAES